MGSFPYVSSSSTPPRRPWPGHAWAVIAVTVLAAFLRLHQLAQLPPGLHHDEAYYGLDAWRVLTGYAPIFFNGNGGREPLHIYLLAGALSLFGDHPWTLRITSVFSSLLAIPLIYGLGRELFRDRPAQAPWIGVLAATALAVTFWHVALSRLGFRAVHVVPISILAVRLAWSTHRAPTLSRYARAGVVLGLSLYTYLAARFLPLVIAGFLATQIVPAWKRLGWAGLLRSRAARGGLVLIGAAALTFGPLGWYFVRMPAAFVERVRAAAVPGMEAGSGGAQLAENAGRVARMFIDQGDLNLRLNLPGRPALDALLAAGLALGLAGALVRFRHPRSALLLLWLVVMLLPTALSSEAPNFLRALGALPPTVVLASAGLAGVWEALTRRWSANSLRWLALTAGLAAVSGGLTFYDYFSRWAAAPGLGIAMDRAQFLVAERALELSRNYDVVIPLESYHYPTTLLLLEPTFRTARPWTPSPRERPVAFLLPARMSWHWPVLVQRHADGSGSHSVMPPLTAEIERRLQNASGEDLLDPDGQPVARITYLPAATFAAAPAMEPLDADFGHGLRLSGYNLERTTGHVRLTLYWQCTDWIDWDYSLFVHLRSAAGEPIDQRDRHALNAAFTPMLWSPGDINPIAEDFVLPQDLPPGKYRFEVGLYNLSNQERLTARVAGQTLDAVQVGLFTMPETAPPLSLTAQPLDVLGGDPPTIKLLGYSLEPGPARPGSALPVTLYWQALQTPDRDYTVFVHLLDETGQLRSQVDAQPLQGRAPTSLWLPGEVFPDRYTLDLGPDLPPGSYTMAFGMYDWSSGQRLPLTDAAGTRLPDDRVLIPGAVRVAP